ncbi:MAG: hypothetical protein JSV09_05110 [Thermoplasmata archaeon]|nr:MAG: hypothetical protein JSV09_05110 [Thermoplasmata archaeon]
MKILPFQRTQLGDVSMPDSFKILDGKKYMWDGETYEGMEHAKKAEENYKKENFEAMIIEDEGGKPLVYTRRVVTEVVLEGEAPV